MVSEGHPSIAVLHPETVMTLDEALVHAAYLVLATMRERDFPAILLMVAKR